MHTRIQVKLVTLIPLHALYGFSININNWKSVALSIIIMQNQMRRKVYMGSNSSIDPTFNRLEFKKKTNESERKKHDKQTRSKLVKPA